MKDINFPTGKIPESPRKKLSMEEYIAFCESALKNMPEDALKKHRERIPIGERFKL